MRKKSFNLSLVFLMFFVFSVLFAGKPIIDSDLTLKEAISGTQAPKDLREKLVLIDVQYYSTDGKLHQGQLVVHEDVKQDVLEIFEIIKEERFPIKKAVPIVEYDWSDDASMEDNNTSAFNYRYIAGTKRLSNHAFGKAVDINPEFNPVIYSDGRISPSGAEYDVEKEGTLTSDHPIVLAFKERGWRWGGDFESFKDYHHFDKQ